MFDLAIPIVIVTAAVLLAWPLGGYMSWAMAPVQLGPGRRRFEHACEHLFGRGLAVEQNWIAYSRSLLVLSNVLVLLIPIASVWMFGRITGRMRHAAVLGASMLLMLAAATAAAVGLESRPTAALAELPVAAAPNLEGKELRFGAAAGPAWAVSTTATSNGSVIRKGAPDAIRKWASEDGGFVPEDYDRLVQRVAEKGGKPIRS